MRPNCGITPNLVTLTSFQRFWGRYLKWKVSHLHSLRKLQTLGRSINNEKRFCFQKRPSFYSVWFGELLKPRPLTINQPCRFDKTRIRRVLGQGDQMSLRKNRPKCSQTHLLSKLMHNFYPGKKLAHGFGIFQKNCQK
jgi:hypothetical protein